MSLAAAATVVSRVVNATDRLQMEANVVICPSFPSGSTGEVFLSTRGSTLPQDIESDSLSLDLGQDARPEACLIVGLPHVGKGRVYQLTTVAA